jgi:hypothetical protein
MAMLTAAGWPVSQWPSKPRWWRWSLAGLRTGCSGCSLTLYKGSRSACPRKPFCDPVVYLGPLVIRIECPHNLLRRTTVHSV